MPENDVVVGMDWHESSYLLRALYHPKEKGSKEILEEFARKVGSARMGLANTAAEVALVKMGADHDMGKLWNPTCDGCGEEGQACCDDHLPLGWYSVFQTGAVVAQRGHSPEGEETGIYCVACGPKKSPPVAVGGILEDSIIRHNHLLHDKDFFDPANPAPCPKDCPANGAAEKPSWTCTACQNGRMPCNDPAMCSGIKAAKRGVTSDLWEAHHWKCGRCGKEGHPAGDGHLYAKQLLRVHQRKNCKNKGAGK